MIYAGSVLVIYGSVTSSNGQDLSSRQILLGIMNICELPLELQRKFLENSPPEMWCAIVDTCLLWKQILFQWMVRKLCTKKDSSAVTTEYAYYLKYQTNILMLFFLIKQHFNPAEVIALTKDEENITTFFDDERLYCYEPMLLDDEDFESCLSWALVLCPADIHYFKWAYRQKCAKLNRSDDAAIIVTDCETTTSASFNTSKSKLLNALIERLT